MTNQEILAKKLRMLRGSKSQMEFASELGITKATVQAIEGQKSNARIDTLDMIAKALDIPSSVLLSDEPSVEQLDTMAYLLQRMDWFLSLDDAMRTDVLVWAQATIHLFSRLPKTEANHERPQTTSPTGHHAEL